MMEEMNSATAGLTLLGKSGVHEPTTLLESFPSPRNSSLVVMTSEEVYSRCPLTHQPDFYTVEVSYVPKERCVESKSFKLKIQSFDKRGIFCEQLGQELLEHVVESITPKACRVVVIQRPRGGVSIRSESYYEEPK